MKKIYIFVSFLIITNISISQTRFSQFYSYPLLFNPAYTGRYNQSVRIGGGFRSEKNASSVYNQSTFSIESKIFNSLIPENDCFAIGITGVNERSPGENTKNDYLSIAFAYQKGLDIEGQQQFGLGFSLHLAVNRLILLPIFLKVSLTHGLRLALLILIFSRLQK